jgi:hypothetical protein
MDVSNNALRMLAAFASLRIRGFAKMTSLRHLELIQFA